jgi:FlaA1/EpsC-like NDP-sugar epimerase
MTIPEASSLVLQAGTTGHSGEIFIFDMGQPVKIIDMAQRLIRLSGLEPGKDIEIKITGKRPGEKLHEELFNENCLTTQTDHPKIFKVIENQNDLKNQLIMFQALFNALKKQDLSEVMRIAQKIVPEFRHENATFTRVN